MGGGLFTDAERGAVDGVAPLLAGGGGVVSLEAREGSLSVGGCAVAPLEAAEVPLALGGAEFVGCAGGWFGALMCGCAAACTDDSPDDAPGLAAAGAEAAAGGCGAAAFGAAGDADLGEAGDADPAEPGDADPAVAAAADLDAAGDEDVDAAGDAEVDEAVAEAFCPAGGELGGAALVPLAGLVRIAESTAPATGFTTLSTLLLTTPSALLPAPEPDVGWLATTTSGAARLVAGSAADATSPARAKPRPNKRQRLGSRILQLNKPSKTISTPRAVVNCVAG
jgi:hypothetical protein